MSMTLWIVIGLGTPSALLFAYLLLEFVIPTTRLERRTPKPEGLRESAPRPRDTGLERALAYGRLLRQPDEWPLDGKRRHRLTQAGRRDRFSLTWVPATRVWTQHRHTAMAGGVDGWRPATTSRTRALLLRVSR